MKKLLKILIPIFIISFLIYYYYQRNSKINENKKKIDKTDLVEKKTTKEQKNDSYDSIKPKETIVLKEDYILIEQEFKGNEKEITSEIFDVNLNNRSFFSLSAYTTIKKSTITLYFRYYHNNNWTEWKILPIDKEINNPKRLVFGLINIFDDIEKIQFKSNQPIEQVVFNIFIPKN
ncbi:MAG: hypothetical protein QM486_11900 [Flavobacteriaceae bacterium]